MEKLLQLFVTTDLMLYECLTSEHEELLVLEAIFERILKDYIFRRKHNASHKIMNE